MVCTCQEVFRACICGVYPCRREDFSLKAPLRAFHGRALRRLPAGLLGVHHFVRQHTDAALGHRQVTAAFSCIRLTFTGAGGGALLHGCRRSEPVWRRRDPLSDEDLRAPLKAAKASFRSLKDQQSCHFHFLRPPFLRRITESGSVANSHDALTVFSQRAQPRARRTYS